jgi:signal transduction histidine kinase
MQSSSHCRWATWLMSLFLIGIVGTASADSGRIFKPNGGDTQSIMGVVDFLEDKTGALALNQVVSGQAGEFAAINPTYHSFGYTNSVFWLRFTLDLSAFHEENFFLVQEFEHLSKQELFYPLGDGKYARLLTGEDVPLASRMYATRSMLLWIPTPKSGPTTYYLKMTPKAGIYADVNLKWASAAGAIKGFQTQNLVFGLFFGSLVILWFYNFFLWVGTRDKLHLYYIYYLGSFIVAFFYIDGYANLVYDLGPISVRVYRAMVFAAMHGLVLFARQFLALHQKIRWLDNWLLIEQWLLFAIGAGYLFFLPTESAYLVSNILNLLLAPPMLLAGYLRIFSGNTPDRIYSLGWTFLVLSTVIYVLRVFGAIPANALTEYSAQAGSTCEALLFSLALVSRFNVAQEEKRNAIREKFEVVELERSRLKQMVEESTESLRQALEARKMVVANASHELLTPINALRLMIDATLMDKSVIPEILPRIAAVADHMTNLAENLLLLDPARPYNERPRVIEDFGLDEKIQGTSYLVPNTSVAFNIDVSACTGLHVRGDLNGLISIIANLLSNAFKFTAFGRVDLIAFAEFDPGQSKIWCTIRVKDTGRGIKESMREQIWDEFVTSGKQAGLTGTGLGLTISRKLAHSMGGTLLLVDTTENEGSVFELRVPFAIVPKIEAQSAASLTADISTATPRRKRILIAEDDRACAYSVELIIRLLHHDVVHVDIFWKLHEVLGDPQQNFDLALIDHRLPGGRGLDYIKHCRTNGIAKYTKLVLMTADINDELLTDAGTVCDDVITKPTTSSRIRALLGEGVAPPCEEYSIFFDAGLLPEYGTENITKDDLLPIFEAYQKHVEETLALIENTPVLPTKKSTHMIHVAISSCVTVGATALANEFRTLEKFSGNLEPAQCQLLREAFSTTNNAISAFFRESESA